MRNADEHSLEVLRAIGRNVRALKAAAKNSKNALDESVASAQNVDLVVSQTGATREAATAALMRQNGDLVSAIMELTS